MRNNMDQNSFNQARALLAERFSKIGKSIPADELDKLAKIMLRTYGPYYVPQFILSVFAKLLDGRSANIVCDPHAVQGAILTVVCETTQAMKALAFTDSKYLAAIGRSFMLSSADWQVGDPFQLLSRLPANLDVVASALHFGGRRAPIKVKIANGATLTLQDDLGHLILVASSMKLSANGVGLFVVPQSFFKSQRSVFKQFDTLGLGITAALAFPSGAFAPYANISTYLVVVGKHPSSQLFVAQLSTDANTNLQIIKNFKQGQEGASLELGRFADVSTFTGIDVMRTSERLEQAERQFGYPAVRLEDLATTITLGRPRNDFTFPKRENAIFVPLIGISNVIESMDDATLKRQNYAQIAIDPTRSNASFVARFLNSEFGREIREFNKSGFIPKLNMQSLKIIRVFIPDLQTQKNMLATETHIITEQNTLLGLQNEIAECRRELWSNPHSQPDVSRRLDALSLRLSGEKRQAVERLDQWFESLPFPMASILRAWQTTQSDDFKTKYEHLLHFFEASAEFAGIILLSAFHSREQVFVVIKKDLNEALKKQNLSFKKATFGTWRLVIECLGKQVRQRMSEDKEQRVICADMFSDPSMQLPEFLSRKELAEILSRTNKLRNDWAGHGGVVGPEESYLRNEQLLTIVQEFRAATGALWSEIQLVHAMHCRPRRGSFENEVAVLMGSNSEFLKEKRVMSIGLDVERLYFARKDGGQALQLLPLVQVGSSPSSAKNACYFFSRIENDGLRYVSYHFTAQPERNFSIEDAGEAMSLLEKNGET